MLEFAISKGIFVPRASIFFDLAERGSSERRPGLVQLHQARAARQFQVLLVFSSNRLYRKAYKAMKFIEEEIVEAGLRCIFVKQDIDTADTQRWRVVMQLTASMDEFYGSAYGDNIRASHMGLAGKGLVYSTLCVGYCAEPIQGELTRRKRPRCRIAIDENAAAYVRQIFAWFVVDQLSIDEIARRLNNDPSAPRPTKSPRGWTHHSVVAVLSNPRYIAQWPCSATETKWLSKADYARQFRREKPLGLFVHEHLRIVSDEDWFRAQVRLKQFVARRGRKPGNGKQKPASRLLNGILACPAHDQMLYVGGLNSQSLFCKVCRETTSAEVRPLFTLLKQDLAVHETTKAVRDLLTGDDRLVQSIVDSCRRAAEQLQQPDESREKELAACDQRLKRSIETALRNVGESPAEQEETQQLVREFRKERSLLQAELKVLEEARKRPVRIPSADDVKAELAQLDETLVSASSCSDPMQNGQAREIIELVTGGRIELIQMGERRKSRGWLRGTFQCDVVSAIASRLAGQYVESGNSSIAVTIDYRQPSKLDEQANRAKELADQGLLHKEIGRQLGCGKSRITQLLRHWYTSRGQQMPDGRARRSTLHVKHTEPPLHQRLAGPVMELVGENWLLGDIAATRHRPAR